MFWYSSLGIILIIDTYFTIIDGVFFWSRDAFIIILFTFYSSMEYRIIYPMDSIDIWYRINIYLEIFRFTIKCFRW